MTRPEVLELIRRAREEQAQINLRGANLYGANLYGADLHGANLCEANLYGANLYGANLCSADLRGADLCEANLYRANLRGADLRGTGVAVVYLAPYTIAVVPQRVQVGCVDIAGAAVIDRLLGDPDGILVLHDEAADVWPVVEPLVRAAVAHSRAERPDLWQPDVPEEDPDGI